jgi:PIN domain nuclease of toxin-antitoxin system
MKVLLDTHTFIWFMLDHPSLSQHAASLIEDPDNEVLISIATLWEMAIKISLGKLHLAKPFGQLIPDQLQKNDFTLLPIEVSHLTQVITLPWHHRDPFDRLMIAQSLAEELPMLSRDVVFDDYNIERIW